MPNQDKRDVDAIDQSKFSNLAESALCSAVFTVRTRQKHQKRQLLAPPSVDMPYPPPG